MKKIEKLSKIVHYLTILKKLGRLIPLQDLGYKKEFTIITRNYSNIVFGRYRDKNGIILYLRLVKNDKVVKKDLTKIMKILKKIMKNEDLTGK